MELVESSADRYVEYQVLFQDVVWRQRLVIRRFFGGLTTRLNQKILENCLARFCNLVLILRLLDGLELEISSRIIFTFGLPLPDLDFRKRRNLTTAKDVLEFIVSYLFKLVWEFPLEIIAVIWLDVCLLLRLFCGKVHVEECLVLVHHPDSDQSFLDG